MRWLPFFGSNNETDRSSNETEGDMTIVTNLDRSNVEVVGADGVKSSPGSGGLTVHTVSLAATDSTVGRASTDSKASRTEAARRSAPSPQQPLSPKTDPDSTDDPHPRGTFVIQNNQHFLQKLEARGKNGHGRIVETVYVLTGPTYTQPTDLICLDNNEFYDSATKTSVRFDPKAMAEKVASLYPKNEAPNVIARFHTHPGGTLRPSAADRDSAPKIREEFVRAFGTDDFEFFHGIHGLEEHNSKPGPSERQSPSTSQGHVRWMGERYRHKLAVFGRQFENKREVAVTN